MNTAEKKRFAPYGPPGTVIRIVRNFRDRDVPETLGPEALAQLGVTEGLVGRILQSLEFLGLVAEDSSTTPEFRAISTKSDEEYKELLSSLIRNAYGGIFRIVNLATVSERDLYNAFRPYSPAGQRSRMVTLFRGLCREAGILVGDAMEISVSIPKPTSQRRVREPSVAQAATREPVRGEMVTADRNTTLTATFQTLIGILDPNKMSEEEQAAVWALIRYLKKQEV